ncbi:calcium-binding protein [Sphingomonas montana]|uniref:calcium-binding protein n=1 Tax=Sphingomonas montana TaxID=1843236 RepID=UPI00096FC365|nr:calcium-binding protein [Sphingomonas montana]
MPSIRIEAKNVTYQGQDTGYDHAYLLHDQNDVPDDGDRVIRGGSGASGSIEIQAGVAIESSLDARRAVPAADRGTRVVTDENTGSAWSLMLQAAGQISAAGIRYTLPGDAVAVRNSNSVIATLLHAVGRDIGDSLPSNSSLPQLAGAETILDFARDLDGGEDADVIVGWKQDDSLSGAGGNDRLFGGAGNDMLTGGAGDDMVYGNQDADHLYGEDGADQLFGGQGDDRLSGGAGDDVLEGGKGTNMADGGAGFDLASYANAGQGVAVSLLLQGQAQATGVSSDVLTGVEGLLGSAFADALNGNGDANRLIGGGGDDGLTAGFGMDMLDGGEGNDILFGNQDADVLAGGLGNDSLYGGQDDDTLSGGGGADLLQGGRGVDWMTGGADADSFRYVTSADSTVAAFDLVTDFEMGLDHVDLTAVRTGAADTLHISSSSGYTFLDVDLGGDGTTDMRIGFVGEDRIAHTDILFG